MSAGIVIVGAGLAGQRCCEALRARGWEGPIRLVGDEEHAPVRPPAAVQGPAGGHDRGRRGGAAGAGLARRARRRAHPGDRGDGPGRRPPAGAARRGPSPALRPAGRRHRRSARACWRSCAGARTSTSCARSTTRSRCVPCWGRASASPSWGPAWSASRWRRPRGRWAPPSPWWRPPPRRSRRCWASASDAGWPSCRGRLASRSSRASRSRRRTAARMSARSGSATGAASPATPCSWPSAWPRPPAGWTAAGSPRARSPPTPRVAPACPTSTRPATRAEQATGRRPPAREPPSAATILGVRAPAPPPAAFWSDQHGVRLQFAGTAAGHDRVEVDGDPLAGDACALFHRGGRLVGGLLVGRPRDLPALRQRLQETTLEHERSAA